MKKKKLGRYVLGSMLGRGGQGAVYKAVMRGPAGFRKTVALKLIKGEGLKREARIGGLLRHPNLVDVYEVGEQNGIWFAAMEFCSGGILNRYIPLPPRAVVDVGLQVCAALQYAHDELGLVHLDLKPSNLLLEGSTVKVADLGIARAEGFDYEKKGPRGTRGYMSPESLRGDAVDARSDIYSMGLVLERLSSGRKQADTPTVISDPGEIEPIADPDDWLAPIRRRTLQRDPADRFQSMDELAEALRALNVEGPGLAEVVRRGKKKTYEPAPKRTNLAGHRDAFVGRSRELLDLETELERPGAILLKGPGGIGKTRLARQAALAYHERTDEQAWFVDLSEAATLTGLLNAIGRALGVTLTRGGPAQQVDQLAHALAARNDVLLVMDTFEHLAGEAEVLRRLIDGAPDARFLITSRTTLDLDATRVDVSPLSVADGVELLAARALARGHDVADDPALTEIARRLDGLPFALELAASRIGVLSPAEVLDHLSLSWLRSGQQAPHRQQTLRATLDWSWNLLDPVERTALAHLSVFRGGFEVRAAEEVLAIPGQPFVLDLLEMLCDASWLSWRDGRFRMLDSARTYAGEHLEDDDAARRHRRYFAGFGTRDTVDRLWGPEGTRLRRELAAEIDNLVVACRRAVDADEARIATECACAAWEVLNLTGPLQAGMNLIEEVLGLEDAGDVHRARLLFVAGLARMALGDLDASEERLHEALGAFMTLDDAQGRADVLRSIGTLYWRLSRTADADHVLAQALDAYAVLGDERGEALALGTLALLREQTGHVDETKAFHERALAIHRAQGDRRNEGIVLGNYGNHEFRMGRIEHSRELIELSLEAHRETGARRSVGIGLGNLAVIDVWNGDVDKANELYAEALTIHREVGNRRFEALVLINLANAEAAHYERIHIAEDLGRKSVAIHRELGQPRQLGYALGVLSRILMERKSYGEARRLSDEALSLLQENQMDLVRVLCYRGELEAAVDNPAAAWGALDRAAEIIEALAPEPDSDLERALKAATAAVVGMLGERSPG